MRRLVLVFKVVNRFILRIIINDSNYYLTKYIQDFCFHELNNIYTLFGTPPKISVSSVFFF